MRSLRVKQVAQAKGFTMAKLQREADINLKTIQAIWHNPRHNASLDTLDKIAAVLRVPVTELIEDVPADTFLDEERKRPVQPPMVLRCPICGTIASIGATLCPSCRASLTGVVPTPANNGAGQSQYGAGQGQQQPQQAMVTSNAFVGERKRVAESDDLYPAS
jgi:DNA-binding Xre family transcriptional regulator